MAIINDIRSSKNALITVKNISTDKKYYSSPSNISINLVITGRRECQRIFE